MFWASKPSYLSVPLELIQKQLSKKRVLIVGGTAGIGRALAQQCIKHGAQVTIVGRRTPDETLKQAKFAQKDLSLLANSVSLTKEIDVSSMDYVVFTNGIITSSTRRETAEGIELDLAVSYLSRFVISEEALSSKSNTLAEKIKKRVFVMGFPGKPNKATLDDFNSEKNYGLFSAHMNTVVGNEALVRHIADLNSSINVYGLNPGLIQTEIRQPALGQGTWLSWIVESIIGFAFQSAEKYAENVLIPLLVSPELEDKNQALFDSDGSILKPNPFLQEGDNYQRLVNESKILVQKALSKQ